MRLHFEADDLEILQGIVEESTEHLSGIEEGVLKLEADFAPEHLDNVFRALHSVKGVAGFVDYTPIKDTAHVLESFLSDMKKGLYIVNPEITDLLLRGIDILNLHVKQLGSHLQAFEGTGANPIEIEIEDYDFESFVREAEDIRQQISNADASPSTAESPMVCPEPDSAEKAAARVMKLELASFLEQSRLDFIEEVYEHLDSIEKNCVLLEREQTNQDLLNAILRGFHSIKGGAGVILSMQEEQDDEGAFNKIKNLTHAVESLLQTYRNMRAGIPAGVVDIILEAVDRSTALAKAIELGQEENVAIEDLMKKLQVFSQNSNEAAAIEEPAMDNSSQIPKQLTAFANITRQALESLALLLRTARAGSPVDDKRVKQYLRALNSIAKSARQMEYSDIVVDVDRMSQKIKEDAKPGDLVTEDLLLFMKSMHEHLNQILDFRLREIEQIYNPPEYCEKRLGEILIAEHKITSEELENALGKQRKLGEVLVESGKVKKEDVDLALARQTIARSQSKENRETAPSGSDAAGGQSIRVPQEKMNRLMNMIGELLISKNRIFHLADQINLEYEIPALARDVKNVAFDIARISDELQDAIMSARMLPLRILFQRYPRTIRDTARKVGKQADLIVEGEETELDKTVLEAINDPLVHMLRNAVDHGIEPPDVRRSLGKPEAGTVLLQARYQGNNVVIEIKDDGKGMNPEEIKAKALKKGLITADQIETMSLEDTFRLIFAPGFSTKEEVSELSGRGVGMDVVKNNIEKVGGSIHMTSVVNQGSHFTLKIPLSMSIIRGLMVRSGGQQFVVPLDCIEETVKISPESIRHYKDVLVADIRGGILHLIPLHEILGMKKTASSEESGNGRISVIVVEVDGSRFGLIVDSFNKEQEFVVKALDEDLARLKVYTGASILGDGNVVLILNPAQLFNLFLSSRKEGEAQWLQ